LTINRPGDRFEQEAERVADAVGHLPAEAQAIRLGAFGGRSAVGPATDLPAGLDGAEGRPLAESVRQSFASRFGHDFGRVRVHAGPRAAATAQALSAAAFTTGGHIFFARDRFAPETATGSHLLAHELVHTMQQGAARGRVAAGVTAAPPMIQRRLLVQNPTGAPAGAPPGVTNEQIVDGYVRTLCPDFGARGGRVVPTSFARCLISPLSATPESCSCLCEMHFLVDPATLAAVDWTIAVDDRAWPHTDDATRTVTVHSPHSGLEFGAWTAGSPAGPPSHRSVLPNWLVLGHELCGHARLFARGTHPTGPAPTHGGRPSHDVTVQIQNTLATEHGIPASELRGLFADPHHGESFAKVTIAQFPSGSSDLAALPTAERRQLDLAERFIRSASVKMDVIGHADQPAMTATANATVSQARARSIRTELERRGIGRSRFLVVDGVGAAECPAPGDQPACRKAEIFMFSMEGASAGHP
jgi:outer membrane protein OmpA-like peptidoglycan-associated protein